MPVFEICVLFHNIPLRGRLVRFVVKSFHNSNDFLEKVLG